MEIKNSLQPKIYTEMMTIRLAEGQDKAELPSNIAGEIETLKEEINQLRINWQKFAVVLHLVMRYEAKQAKDTE